MSKSRDIADSAATINYIDGVTSNVQTQLNTLTTAVDNISVTNGSLTKTFTAGESSEITLSSSVLAPVVSVIKEVPQTGVTNNSWDAAAGSYALEDSAYATSLSWGVDLASSTFNSSFNIGSQETVGQGLAFSSDGTKMYIVGLGVDTVFQYSLSTAFDVSTASYNSVSFSVASQETTPLGLDFSADGTKMYVVGYTNSIVYQYTLSTAWDLSTASYSTISFDLNSQETQAVFVTIASSGTKMYIRGFDNGNVFYQYTLSTAYDVSTASYDSISFNPSSNAADPKSLSFNNNGTLVYIMGGTADAVYQYSLSTAFNISTASYDSINFSVSSQDNQPADMSVLGDKLYFIGGQNTSVYQYTLGLGGLQLGTGSFASTDVGKTINVNDGVLVLTATDGSYSETTAPTSTDTAASGEWSMFGAVYNATDDVLEVSSYVDGYDLTVASYIQDFSLSSQGSNSFGMSFSTDGTKMFVLFYSNDTVFEYVLSTPFDLSTASYNSVSLSIGSQDTEPLGICFSSDGTKMYMSGSTNDSIFQYGLSTAWDLSSASYSSISFSISGQDGYPDAVKFSTDGTKMFMLGTFGKDINEYTVLTPFNVSTAVFVDSFSVNPQDTQMQGFAFNIDGTKMFMVGIDGQDVNEYILTTGFDISTASYVRNFSVGTQDIYPRDISFNDTGTKMFVLGSANTKVYEYSTGLTTTTTGYQPCISSNIDSAYWTDINSLTATNAIGDGNVFYAVSNDARDSWSVLDNTDGVRDIVRNNAGTWQYNSNGTYTSETWANASTNTEVAALRETMEGAESGYNLASASFTQNFSVSSEDSSPRGVAFNTDGTKMFVTGGAGIDINEYALSIGFDTSTASYSQNFSVISQTTSPRGVAFNTDGTKMFVVGQVGSTIYEYDLTTGFDVSTASYSQSFSVSSQETAAQDLSFNADGTKMFIIGTTGQDANEYTLTTGFDVSTASFVDSFSIASEDTIPTGITFSTDGTSMFILGQTNDKIFEYALTTGFDVSTASYSSTSFSVASEETSPIGLVFSANGTKMFITGTAGDKVNEYSTNSYTNQMDSTALNAITDANQITLGDDLDFAAILYYDTGSTVPTYSGTAINYDANILNQGAVLGTDYNFDAPAGDKVRITAVGAGNYKVRVV